MVFFAAVAAVAAVAEVQDFLFAGAVTWIQMHGESASRFAKGSVNCVLERLRSPL